MMMTLVLRISKESLTSISLSGDRQDSGDQPGGRLRAEDGGDGEGEALRVQQEPEHGQC